MKVRNDKFVARIGEDFIAVDPVDLFTEEGLNDYQLVDDNLFNGLIKLDLERRIKDEGDYGMTLGYPVYEKSFSMDKNSVTIDGVTYVRTEGSRMDRDLINKFNSVKL